ncbi:MAG: hypothetical protein JST86_13695 [Bacteroidetes bacterium]|nr:hypothetical protein [Bacteroidota bacterium]
MASFGKKILSAFVEVTEEKKPVTAPEVKQGYSTPVVNQAAQSESTRQKFSQYFDKLFSDANLPGPDYYEFSKMTKAMTTIADEKARFIAAFAGLSVQGLDKNKLLETATAYLKILETDATNFNASVDAALKEKVQGRRAAIENKQQRIEQLNREISDLQHQIQLLEAEVKESEEKIESNTGGYQLASNEMQQQVQDDINKIKQYLS